VARHADHDAVHDEVRSWYTASTPEIGLSILAEGYGFLTDASDWAGRRRVVLTVESPDEVAPALAQAADFYGTGDFEVWVDDHGRADRLTAALRAAGRTPALATVTLALGGPLRAEGGPDGLGIEDVLDEEQLAEWAATKIAGFADDEARPSPEALEAELVGRRAEWPVCRYRLARLGAEPVAVLGHYTGRDQMAFNLATRVPFRHRGIASAMLARWSEEEAEPAVRSRLINCDEGGAPEALYRTLGFTDEVYWYRRFARVD
jgi:hypothetical protein